MKLVILSGPSGVGKSPAVHALKKMYRSEMSRVGTVTLFTSRAKRLNEVEGRHYHFRSRKEILGFDRSRFLVVKVRQDVQAIDVDEVKQNLKKFDVLFAEVYPTLGMHLSSMLPGVPTTRIAMVPFSSSQLNEEAARLGTNTEEALAIAMRKKITGRHRNLYKTVPTTAELRVITDRARQAFDECQWMDGYEHTVVNEIGEDCEKQWSLPLRGRTLRVVQEIASCLFSELVWQRVAYGPVFDGPGPGDGSDAVIGTDWFFGPPGSWKEPAQKVANSLSDETRNVVCWLDRIEELKQTSWVGYQ